MKKVLIIMLLLSFLGCTDAPRAERVLRQNGYKDVQITGYRFFGCGEDDECATGFKAVSPNGEIVTGVVCSGYFGGFSKGATIRLD